MATGLLNANASSVTLECNGVTAMIAKDTGVVAAGAAGVSGNDLVTVGQLGLSKYYESPEQMLTAGGLLTLTHGLGVAPRLIQCSAVCKVADLGYSVGDVLLMSGSSDTAGTSAGIGLAVIPQAASIDIRIGNSAFMSGINKATGAASALTPASWRLIVRAWA